jgi:hypothetical protein
MDSDRILGLFKFAKRAHIDAFLRGTLYMNTIDYFAQIEAAEGNCLRRDPFEGVGRLIPAEGGVLSVRIGEEFRPVGHIEGSIQWRPADGIQANVFCMYALRPSTGPNIIDERNLGFGDAFAVLTDGNEFLTRARKAATATGHELQYGIVEYFCERTYEGPVGIFRKRDVFRYQSEFRMALVPGVNKPYCFDIGDISDICKAGILSDINKRLRLTQTTL